MILLGPDHPKVMPDPMAGCWIWIGARTDRGYGHLRDGRRHVYAHRVAYEQRHGPIPPELEIDHRCRVRACVNPEHLEAVSWQENLLRGPEPNMMRVHLSGKCLRGHDNPQGPGRCRVCGARRMRESRARRRMAR